MNKIKYTWSQFDQDLAKLALQISQSRWRPDYIVGISRGGCTPAVALSHALGVPMRPLLVSLRDGDPQGCTSDGGMSEDAFGYVTREDASLYFPAGKYLTYHDNAIKNILIVDDINDTGQTFQWIQQDWQQSCLPDHNRWEKVWHHNVKFAVLHNNEASRFKNTDFAANYINKQEQDVWIVYPWEALSQDK